MSSSHGRGGRKPARTVPTLTEKKKQPPSAIADVRVAAASSSSLAPSSFPPSSVTSTTTSTIVMTPADDHHHTRMVHHLYRTVVIPWMNRSVHMAILAPQFSPVMLEVTFFLPSQHGSSFSSVPILKLDQMTSLGCRSVELSLASTSSVKPSSAPLPGRGGTMISRWPLFSSSSSSSSSSSTSLRYGVHNIKAPIDSGPTMYDRSLRALAWYTEVQRSPSSFAVASFFHAHTITNDTKAVNTHDTTSDDGMMIGWKRSPNVKLLPSLPSLPPLCMTIGERIACALGISLKQFREETLARASGSSKATTSSALGSDDDDSDNNSDDEKDDGNDKNDNDDDGPPTVAMFMWMDLELQQSIVLTNGTLLLVTSNGSIIVWQPSLPVSSLLRATSVKQPPQQPQPFGDILWSNRHPLAWERNIMSITRYLIGTCVSLKCLYSRQQQGGQQMETLEALHNKEYGWKLDKTIHVLIRATDGALVMLQTPYDERAGKDARKYGRNGIPSIYPFTSLETVTSDEKGEVITQLVVRTRHGRWCHIYDMNTIMMASLSTDTITRSSHHTSDQYMRQTVPIAPLRTVRLEGDPHVDRRTGQVAASSLHIIGSRYIIKRATAPIAATSSDVINTWVYDYNT